MKAPERVNSVKMLSKTLRDFFNGVTLLIILNKKAKSIIGYVSRENLCELGHTNQINTDPLIIPQDLYLVLKTCQQ